MLWHESEVFPTKLIAELEELTAPFSEKVIMTEQNEKLEGSVDIVEPRE